MPKQNKNDLELLIKQNNRKLDSLLKKMDHLDHSLKRFQLMNFLRFIIVAVPIIVAILWFIPIFRDFLKLYEPLIEILQNFKAI